jgi:ethanolamine ammonia-lyase small subunit
MGGRSIPPPERGRAIAFGSDDRLRVMAQHPCLSFRPSEPGFRPATESRNPVIKAIRAFTPAVDYWVPARASPVEPGSLGRDDNPYAIGLPERGRYFGACCAAESMCYGPTARGRGAHRSTGMSGSKRPERAAVRESVPESWLALHRHTPARIALGRVGSGLPTHAYLEFQAAHARARDAVHASLDLDAMMQSIAACGLPVIPVRSAAEDRQAYLRMPDLGRRLAAESEARLSEPIVAPDVVIVIGDGLSSVAVERNAVPVLQYLVPRLQAAGLQLTPIILAVQARVALADEIGDLLQAGLSLIMIGERPGLSAADSLGIYLTFAPRLGRVDSERNCISNIRDGGMRAADAATQAADLIRSMLEHQASGVLLRSRMHKRLGSDNEGI